MSSITAAEKFLKGFVSPWYDALQNPAEAQSRALENLVRLYRKTEYGKQHSANDLKSITDFRSFLPKLDYNNLQPYLKRVKEGDYQTILPEPPLTWVMTRGSTGAAKILPVTPTHLDQIFRCGARAIVNFALRKKDLSVLSGYVLNLNFPSTVASMRIGERTLTYGYSSGTYAKLNPMLSRASLLPKQEEIDSIGPGITKADWINRFELVYGKALHQDVTAVMGVTPVMLSFARYVARVYKRKPKELWRLKALFCTSVRKIQFKYAPRLKAYYGEVPIVEMYTATEGVFGQQLDDFPYISPNYDEYLFEVETRRGSRLLHELRRGEWGRLIVSSCLFPRYDIGDMIEAMGNNYFRVFGRANAFNILEHKLYRFLYGWFL